MGRFWGAGVLYGYQTRDLSSVSIVVSLEESDQRSPNQEFGLGSLVWEKRVSCAQNLCFEFRMLRGLN